MLTEDLRFSMHTPGVPKLRTHPRLAIMYPFFERVRLPDATNFDIK